MDWEFGISSFIHTHTHTHIFRLTQWLSSKESTCNAEGTSSNTGSGTSPGGGHGSPLQYSCLENPMDRGAWWPHFKNSQETYECSLKYIKRIMKSNRTPGSTYALFWCYYSGVTTPQAPTSPAATSAPARRHPGETNAPTSRAVTSGIIKYARTQSAGFHVDESPSPALRGMANVYPDFLQGRVSVSEGKLLKGLPNQHSAKLTVFV